MAWSLPEGYELISATGSPGVTLIAARWARADLLDLGVDRPESLAAGPGVADWVGGGRVRHPVLAAGQERWLLKAYRRGGFFARWNRERYWRVGRFVEELRTALAAARAGVPAPEPIALVFKAGGWGGGYRVWQLVRYVPGVVSLRDILLHRSENGTTSGESPGRAGELRAMFRAAGAAVRKMHEAQIDHPDLNIGNILARAVGATGGGAAAEAFIVDWDRARARQSGSWNPHSNLARLWRSALKLAWQRHGRGIDGAALRAFVRGYFGHNRAELRRLRGYLRPRRALVALHVALWEMARMGKSA